MKKFWATVLFSISLATTFVAQESAPATQPAGPKKVFFWCLIWPDSIGKFDPETDTLVDKIKTKNGLVHEWKRSSFGDQFLVVTGQKMIVEVLDIKTKTTIDQHVFAETGYVVRVDDVREIPGNTHWYVRVSRIKLIDDHYDVDKPETLYYNIKEKKIEKRMKEAPRELRGAIISPDKKKWHVLGSDIKVIDPVTLKEESKIELSKPLYFGMGPLRVSGDDDFYHHQNPDAYRFIYTMRDPVKKNRSLFGLIDINMKEMKIEKMTEWGKDPGVWNFQLAWNNKVAVAQGGGGFGGRGDDEGRSMLTLFDLSNGQKIREAEHKFRPRRWLMGISPDGKKIYIGGAGNDLEVFDQDLKPLKQVWLDGDLGGNFVVSEE